MSSILEGLAGTAERYTGQALAFGLGFALANVLEPAAVALRQEAWAKGDAQIRALDPGTVAQIVAQALEGADWGNGEAAFSGVDDQRLKLLTDAARTAPGVGELLALLRRDRITPDELEHGLDKHKLEAAWHSAIADLEHLRLEPAEIAKAIHRGIMAGEGLLLLEPPTAPGKVAQVPQSPLDTLAEAKASGIDKERLRVMVGNAGLPPGIMEMLQLVNRGEIEESDFLRGVGESNLRNEWGPAIFALKRRLLTPHDYVEARVRAWIDTDAMHKGAELSGMEASDTDLLFKIAGRPLSWHQVFVGLRRGGEYGGDTADIDPAFLKALEESNIRPEWYSLAWAQRYTFPSTFVLRSMAQAGELTQAETEQILLYEAWEPTLAKKASTRWAGAGASGGKQATVAELETEYQGGHLTEQQFRQALALLDYTAAAQDHLVALGDARRSKRYRDAAIAAIAKAYTLFAINGEQASSELASLSVAAGAAAELLSLWDKQRLYTIRELTPAQVKAAFVHGVIPRDSALAALGFLHYTPASAAELLDT